MQPNIRQYSYLLCILANISISPWDSLSYACYDFPEFSAGPVFTQRKSFNHWFVVPTCSSQMAQSDIFPAFLQVAHIRRILATAVASAGQGVLGYCGEYSSSLYPLDYRPMWAIWWKLICCLHGTVYRQIWFGDATAPIWSDGWQDFTVSALHRC